MRLAPMFAELFGLQEQIRAAIKDATPDREPRTYTWRPPRLPELPAIWNWIDDGSYELESTGMGKDLLIVTMTLGVEPGSIVESGLDALVAFTDDALAVLDPALARRPLNGTVVAAKRLQMATRQDEFVTSAGDVPVICMDLPIEVQLRKNLNPA